MASWTLVFVLRAHVLVALRDSEILSRTSSEEASGTWNPWWKHGGLVKYASASDPDKTDMMRDLGCYCMESMEVRLSLIHI